MKKILNLIVIISFTLILTGCGSKETNNNTNNNGENTNNNTQKNNNSKKTADETSIAFLNKTYNGEYYDGTTVAFKVTKFNKEKGITEISVDNTIYKLTKSEIFEYDYGTVYYAEYEDLTLNMSYKSSDSFSIKASIVQNSKMYDNDNNKNILKLGGNYK